MQPTNRLAFALALALGTVAAGCGVSTPSGMGGDDGGGGDDQPRPLNATGTYAMHSTFDLATNMPGTAGDVVNTIIAATDNGDDPTRWIIDQILRNVSDATVKSALQIVEDLGVGELNQELLKLTPDFVPTMVQVGQDFGDIAKHFGLEETLDLTGSGNGYTGVHTVVGVHYQFANQEGEFTFANYQVPNVVVKDVGVTMDRTGQLTIAAHDVPLSYGKLLRLGLDAAIIPAIDSSARNLNDLFAHKIDCTAFGAAIAQVIADHTTLFTVSASTVASACTAGLAAGANFVYQKIDEIDGTALKFSINGSARAVDRNNDRRIDQIQTGTWGGTLAYGTTPTPLIPATFFGERQ